MNRSLNFPSDVLDQMTAPMKIGVAEILRNYKKMERMRLTDDQFLEQVRFSIVALGEVLSETIGTDPQKNNIVEQAESVEEAILFILNAINNRLHSNRFIYETKYFGPQNVGPLSQIYSFYENFIDFWERLIEKYNLDTQDKGPSSNLSILIDVSLHASADAKLFVPSSHTEQPKIRFIGITLNEAMFYNIRETLVYLLHEVGHHVRPNDRVSRNTLFFELLASMVGTEIYYELFGNLFPLPEDASTDLKELVHAFEVIFHNVAEFTQVSLREHFNKFAEAQDLSTTTPPNMRSLRDFHSFVSSYLEELESELNRILLAPSNSLESAYTLFKSNLEVPKVAPNVKGKSSVFGNICKACLAALNKRKRPESKTIQYYSNVVTSLGLVEDTPTNLERFLHQVLKLLKVALDKLRQQNYLSTCFELLNESKADMFVIRALNIQDAETFQKIVGPIVESYATRERFRYFSSRHEIIKQYFEKINPKASKDRKVFPFLLSEEPAEIREIDEPEIYDEVMVALFDEISNYLLKEDDIFPEEKLFIRKEAAASSDNTKLTDFRRKFSTLVNEPGFDAELEIIRVFKGSENDRNSH